MTHRLSPPSGYLSGLGVSVPTLADERGLHHTAHIKLLQRLRSKGAKSFLVAGTRADAARSFAHRLELAVVSCAAVAGVPVVVAVPSSVSDEQLASLTGFATHVLVPGSLMMTAEELADLAARARAAYLGLVLLHRPGKFLVHPRLARHLVKLGVQVLHDSDEIAGLYALRDAGVHVVVGSSSNLLRAGSSPAAISEIAVVDIHLVKECMNGDLDAHATLMELESLNSKNRTEWLHRAALDIVSA